MVRVRRSVLLAVVAGLLAGCAGTAAVGSAARTNPNQVNPVATINPIQSTTTVRSGYSAPTSTLPDCKTGSVTVTLRPPELSPPVCVQVGAILVMTGGYEGSGGSWPGPPTISDRRVLTLTSSVSSGTTLTAHFKAVAVGSTTVRAQFVGANSECTPTPCTPIPGMPLVLSVTVVASSGRG
jgi:WD40 repeat protein